jgi:glyoxylase-like metal-dependent hydrolase (beta-lactamase superfamily II)
MKKMHQSEDSHIIPMTSVSSGRGHEIKPDVFYYTNQIVNLVFVGNPIHMNWVLIDAGMPGSADEIIKVAESRFGRIPPKAILLTHGHFDHVGSIVKLLKHWKGSPVYAHPLEFPFITGQQAYPEPDSSVEGGLLAKISSIYPHEPIDISAAVWPLQENNLIRELPSWRWIHTPGHSPGHVSFYRDEDKVLIAGDAFVTVRQDSFFKVLLQKEEVNGPPRYLTTDWDLARQSVTELAALHPEVAITGHGQAMSGTALEQGLQKLSQDFERLAVPKYGKFVDSKK